MTGETFNYVATHRSKADGSDAMFVRYKTSGGVVVLKNEDGHEWEDFLDRWEPIPQYDDLDTPEPSAERWRMVVRVIGENDDRYTYRYGDADGLVPMTGEMAASTLEALASDIRRHLKESKS